MSRAYRVGRCTLRSADDTAMADQLAATRRAYADVEAERAVLQQRITILEDLLTRREARIADLERGSDADGQEWASEVAELRRQLTRHVDLVNERNGQMRELRRQLAEAQSTIVERDTTITTLRSASHRAQPGTWRCCLCGGQLQYVMAGEKVIPMADGTAIVVCPACVDRAVRAALDATKEDADARS